MHSHYGHMPIIRQCIQTGMQVIHEGRTYRVSVVQHDKKRIHVQTLHGAFHITDAVLEVLINWCGEPLMH